MTSTGIIHIQMYNRHKIRILRFSFLFLQMSFHIWLEWRGIFIFLIKYPTTEEPDSKLKRKISHFCRFMSMSRSYTVDNVL